MLITNGTQIINNRVKSSQVEVTFEGECPTSNLPDPPYTSEIHKALEYSACLRKEQSIKKMQQSLFSDAF